MTTHPWLKPRTLVARPAPWASSGGRGASPREHPFVATPPREHAAAPLEVAPPHVATTTSPPAAPAPMAPPVPPKPDLSRLANQLESAHASALSHLHNDMVALAMMVARHVVGDELRSNPDALLRATHAALADVVGSQGVVVRAHPDDVGTLTAAGLSTKDGARALELRSDVTLNPGDVVVEAPCGTVDARVATRFAAAERALQEALLGATP